MLVQGMGMDGEFYDYLIYPPVVPDGTYSETCNNTERNFVFGMALDPLDTALLLIGLAAYRRRRKLSLEIRRDS